MKKKLLSTLLCVSMVSVMLVGCGKDAGSEGGAEKDTTVEQGTTEVQQTTRQMVRQMLKVVRFTT